MRYSSLLVTLLATVVVSTANASTKAGAAANGAATVELYTPGVGTTEVAVPPPPKIKPAEMTTKKNTIMDKRPSMDMGLRYSSNDWFTNFITTPGSMTLNRIKFHLLTNVAMGALAIVMHNKYPNLVSLPMTGHSLLGSSLGLLLSYRTNSAYARFWEARGHWTNTKSSCRNLAVLMKTHIAPTAPKATAKFLEQLAAFPGTLMFLCLGGAARLPDYAQKFLPEDTNGYQDQPSLPAIRMISELQATLHEAVMESKSAKWHLTEAAHINAISHMVDGLMDKMSNCEKILRTPVPWTYSRHTSRFLTLWLGTLPWVLVDTMKPWLVMAIIVAASYCMLGIEEIGHLIEQPFLGDPLEGNEKLWLNLDENGESSPLIKRGRTTKPYDIGIPVCSLAAQIRQEVTQIAQEPSHH